MVEKYVRWICERETMLYTVECAVSLTQSQKYSFKSLLNIICI